MASLSTRHLDLLLSNLIKLPLLQVHLSWRDDRTNMWPPPWQVFKWSVSELRDVFIWICQIRVSLPLSMEWDTLWDWHWSLLSQSVPVRRHMSWGHPEATWLPLCVCHRLHRLVCVSQMVIVYNHTRTCVELKLVPHIVNAYRMLCRKFNCLHPKLLWTNSSRSNK